ncbi:MAG: ester cyclase [Pseudomonadota bacterium]
MKRLTTTVLAAAILILPMAGIAQADNKAVVQKFYDFLSNPTSANHAAAVKTATSEKWESIGDYSGKVKSRDKFVAQVGGFGKLIPDLNWAVEDMIEDGDTIVVRGRATGTPAGPLFGVDGNGKSFEIMSIDIHTLEEGRIVRTYHVEDWAGALRQLSAE